MVNYFLDTNILWWYLVGTSRHHSRIKKYLDLLLSDVANQFYVNEFVVIELAHLLIKHKGKEGHKILTDLFQDQYPFFTILFDLEEITDLKRTVDILLQYGMESSIGGRDASILLSLEKNGMTELISHDQGFLRVEHVNLHDPLEEEV
jgi:predicted nucleic acid-binding protein